MLFHVKRSLLIRSFIFLPESAVMTPIGHIVVTCCLHKRSCKKSARCAQSDASQTAHRNAGAKCIHFLFPCFGSAAFGTLGWNTCHNLNSILHDIKVVPQKPGGDKPRRVNDCNVTNRAVFTRLSGQPRPKSRIVTGHWPENNRSVPWNDTERF